MKKTKKRIGKKYEPPKLKLVKFNKEENVPKVLAATVTACTA